MDGPARLRPRIAEEADLGDVAAVRGVFARLRSRRVVGKCVVRAAGGGGEAAGPEAAEGTGGAAVGEPAGRTA